MVISHAELLFVDFRIAFETSQRTIKDFLLLKDEKLEALLVAKKCLRYEANHVSLEKN